MGRLTEGDIAELQKICPGGLEQDVDLSSISQWRVGGRADLLVRPASTGELAALRRFFHERSLPSIVIGLTSNLLFSDHGLRVPCIQIGHRMADATFIGNNVHAQAGIWVPYLALRMMRAALTGAEHICGIPGTLGGLICMNGGSQQKGIASSLVEVESVAADGTIQHRATKDCGFSYRRSIFQGNGEIIASAHLRLSSGDRRIIRRTMRSILAERRNKFPRKEPNCGSVFKSNPAMYDKVGPPGAVIERLGFKGMQEGQAQISPRHANFIVNKGGAKARDILTLITRISSAVEAETGFRMEAETSYVTPQGVIRPTNRILPGEFA